VPAGQILLKDTGT